MQQYKSKLILDRYQILKIISKSKTTILYKVRHIYTGDRAIIKYQIKPTKIGKLHILHQAGFLQELQGYQGVPFMVWSGHISQEDALVKEIGVIIEELGCTLEELYGKVFSKLGRGFSLKTTCMIGIEAIHIIENMHLKGIIHQHIKPASFCIGSFSRNHKIYIIDYLRCRRYLIKKTKTHDEEKIVQKIAQISPFMSLNQLSHSSCSRRDDVQSLLYTLIFFLKQKLPWSIECQDEEQKVYLMKNKMIQTSLQELTDGLPKEFGEMLLMVQKLDYKQQPDYGFVRKCFKKIMIKNQYENDGIYDWSVLQEEALGMSIQNFQIKDQNDKNAEKYYFKPHQEKIDVDQFPEAKTIYSNQSRISKVDPFSENISNKKRRRRNGCQII